MALRVSEPWVAGGLWRLIMHTTITRILVKICRGANAARLLVALSCMAAPASLHAQDPGIFAEFNTSMGSFTCRLEYALAPRAVANFIGLATGQRAYLHIPTGRVRSGPYYTNLIFHRVVSGFVIQTGSLNGQGTDGPGYAFPDEFSPQIRHDGPGVLSMANSGTNSNGAQFFVTVAAAPWLDNLHTAFGRVVAGQEVVNAISEVATDSNNKPLTNVWLYGIQIRRVGAEAEAFDIHAQSLPVVSTVPLSLAVTGAMATLSFSNSLYAQHYLAASSNLATWSGSNLGIETVLPLGNSVTQALSAPFEFYTLSRVQYPGSTFSPRSLFQKRLTLEFLSDSLTITIDFDNAGGGTYTFADQSGSLNGTVDYYSWYQEPYRGAIWPIYYSGIIPMTLRLDFSDDTSGRFSGTAYPSQSSPFAINGLFTLESR